MELLLRMATRKNAGHGSAGRGTHGFAGALRAAATLPLQALLEEIDAELEVKVLFLQFSDLLENKQSSLAGTSVSCTVSQSPGQFKAMTIRREPQLGPAFEPNLIQITLWGLGRAILTSAHLSGFGTRGGG